MYTHNFLHFIHKLFGAGCGVCESTDLTVSELEGMFQQGIVLQGV